MQDPKRYWFPTKTYGWGWGFPTTWQGRAVLAVYVGALLVLFFRVPPHLDFGRYILYFCALTAVYVVVCWLKGEPPRWRWGGK